MILPSLVINLNLHPRLDGGVYADVFQVDDKAYKLFITIARKSADQLSNRNAQRISVLLPTPI
jgi:hypothetical protein